MIRPVDIVAALTAAAGAAGATYGVATALILIASGFLDGPPDVSQLLYGLGNALMAVGYVGLASSIVFLIGLIIVGGPIWFVMHQSDVRSRSAAVLTGMLATCPVPLIAWVLSPAAASSWLIIYCGAVVLAGGVAGWTLHRVAYGRDPKS